MRSPSFEKRHGNQRDKDDQRATNGVDRRYFGKDEKTDKRSWHDVEIEHWRQKACIGPAKGTNEKELGGCRQKAGHDHHEELCW